MASDASTRSEADILTELSSAPDTPADPQLPVPKLFDSFDVKGPNGVHDVLTLEPLGRNYNNSLPQCNGG